MNVILLVYRSTNAVRVVFSGICYFASIWLLSVYLSAWVVHWLGLIVHITSHLLLLAQKLLLLELCLVLQNGIWRMLQSVELLIISWLEYPSIQSAVIIFVMAHARPIANPILRRWYPDIKHFSAVLANYPLLLDVFSSHWAARLRYIIRIRHVRDVIVDRAA